MAYRFTANASIVSA